MISLKKIVRNKTDWPVRKRKRQLMRINEIIEEEIKQHKARVMIKKAKSLQSDNKMHSGTFWELKKQMDRMNKGETPSSMFDKNVVEKSTREEIREIFEDFYKDLFTHTINQQLTQKSWLRKLLTKFSKKS